jgi:hypothetical protein
MIRTGVFPGGPARELRGVDVADQKKDRAEADLKKLQQAKDGQKAMLDYEAEAAAIRAKTERLRALRLARDAALPPPAPKKTAARAKKGVPAKRAGTASLSTWLDEQKDGGHRS